MCYDKKAFDDVRWEGLELAEIDKGWLVQQMQVGRKGLAKYAVITYL